MSTAISKLHTVRQVSTATQGAPLSSRVLLGVGYSGWGYSGWGESVLYVWLPVLRGSQSIWFLKTPVRVPCISGETHTCA